MMMAADAWFYFRATPLPFHPIAADRRSDSALSSAGSSLRYCRRALFVRLLAASSPAACASCLRRSAIFRSSPASTGLSPQIDYRQSEPMDLGVDCGSAPPVAFSDGFIFANRVFQLVRLCARSPYQRQRLGLRSTFNCAARRLKPSLWAVWSGTRCCLMLFTSWNTRLSFRVALRPNRRPAPRSLPFFF